MGSSPVQTNQPLKMEMLLLSGDQKTTATLFPLVQTTTTRAQICSDSDLAVEMLARWKFDAVIVDCDEVPKGLDVLRSVRAAPSNKNTVAFALVSHTPVARAFELGATFVLNKPIARDRVRCALQAAYSLMLLGRRRYYRRPVVASARFAGASGEDLRVYTVNVSEGGICIAGASLPQMGEKGTITFRLPSVPTPICATAEVRWMHSSQAGLRFDRIANDGISLVRQWISESLEGELLPGTAKEAQRCPS